MDSWGNSVQADRLQKFFSRRRQQRLYQCAPNRFKSSKPGDPVARPADHGTIVFSGRELPLPARFMRLANSRVPWTADQEYASRCADLLHLHWGLPEGHALISVIGFEHDSPATLPPARLISSFSAGLARAAVATCATVVTNGLAGGVASVVGKAIADHDATHRGTALGVSVHILGIAPYGAVLGKESIAGCRGGEVHLGGVCTPEAGCAQCDRYHTHFLLPEASERGVEALGGERSLRSHVEMAIGLVPRTAAHARSKSAISITPRFLVVLSGGPRTLAAVASALQNGYQVVLIADSGGAAAVIGEFLGMTSSSSARARPKPQAASHPAQDPSPSLKGAIRAIPEAFREKFAGSLTELRLISSLVDGGATITQVSAEEADLDVHMLECVLRMGDASENRDWRLASAVGWDQPAILRRLLQCETHSEAALRMAMQVAITSRRVHHVKLLVNAQPSLAYTIDQIELFRCDNAFLRSDGFLHAALNEIAMSASSSKNSLANGGVNADFSRARRAKDALNYSRIMRPFLSQYVPGIEARFDSRNYKGPSLGDLLLWACFVGDSDMSRDLFHLAAQEHGDPIRLALLASRVSSQVANVDNSRVSGVDRRHYEKCAMRFERWATEILEHCGDENEAARVLLRPSAEGWPNSILRLAVDGDNKLFVSNRYVQSLVNEAWRGNYLGSKWALARHALSISTIAAPLSCLEAVTTASVIGLAVKATAAKRQGKPRNLKDSFERITQAADDTVEVADPIDKLKGLLAVPRMKFFLFLSSYLTYLFLYYSVLSQNMGLPHWRWSLLDMTFYVWAFGLLVAELWQLWQNVMSGEEHFASVWNIVDLVSPFVILCVAVRRCGEMNVMLPVLLREPC